MGAAFSDASRARNGSCSVTSLAVTSPLTDDCRADQHRSKNQIRNTETAFGRSLCLDQHPEGSGRKIAPRQRRCSHHRDMCPPNLNCSTSILNLNSVLFLGALNFGS